MKFMDEFKEFVARGNVVDMAVGIVIGGAFTSIVTSLVDDVITPALALLAKLFRSGSEAAGVAEGTDKLMDMKNWMIPGTAINIGSFIQSIISFLILAFVIFCMVKGINKMRSKFEKEKEEAPAETPADIKLLEEIRDALVKKN